MYKIYKITNIKNGKCYIGQTKNGLKKRFESHKSLKKGTLYQEIKSFGCENFSIIIIDRAETKTEANDKEEFWTIFFKANDPAYGYNKCVVYNILRGKDNPNYGKTLSAETRLKISKTLKGRFSGPKNPYYGKHHSKDALKKMSGENHWSTRHKISDETRKKMSEAQSGEKSNTARPCICIETGEIFPYMKLAAIKYNISSSKITACCRGKRKTTGGYHWAYIDEGKRKS